VIILDTNVISALMMSEPDASVVAWLDRCPPESVWTTSVTVFEVRFGLELLAAGRKRRRLEEAFERALREDFQDRILSFDAAAAAAAARLGARRRRKGKPVDMRDTQIAGITTERRATLATRNTRHFEDLDIRLINPWT
jgi:predicted nucleic acid-binding protein